MNGDLSTYMPQASLDFLLKYSNSWLFLLSYNLAQRASIVQEPPFMNVVSFIGKVIGRKTQCSKLLKKNSNSWAATSLQDEWGSSHCSYSITCQQKSKPAPTLTLLLNNYKSTSLHLVCLLNIFHYRFVLINSMCILMYLSDPVYLFQIALLTLLSFVLITNGTSTSLEGATPIISSNLSLLDVYCIPQLS